MAWTVRSETRQRSFFGKIVKWTFVGFNVLMAVVMMRSCSTAGQLVNSAHSDAEQAGTAIGATVAGGMILTLWVAGVIILGALTLFTRGKKIIVEENVE